MDTIQIRLRPFSDLRPWETIPPHREIKVTSAFHAQWVTLSDLFLAQCDQGRWNYKGSQQGHYYNCPDHAPSYLLFQKYRVEAGSVKDFLDRYYKPERYTGRGPTYAAVLLASYEKEFITNGFCHTSHHDNITGRIISFYGPTL